MTKWTQFNAPNIHLLMVTEHIVFATTIGQEATRRNEVEFQASVNCRLVSKTRRLM